MAEREEIIGPSTTNISSQKEARYCCQRRLREKEDYDDEKEERANRWSKKRREAMVLRQIRSAEGSGQVNWAIGGVAPEEPGERCYGVS